MEHSFRTALWMFPLIAALLQAAPITNEIVESNFCFECLRQRVTCHGNVTFKSPNDMPNSCLSAAVETIKEGLEHARKYCECRLSRCDLTIEALKDVNMTLPYNNSSDCKKQKEGSLNFEAFLREFETVIERINSLAK